MCLGIQQTFKIFYLINISTGCQIQVKSNNQETPEEPTLQIIIYLFLEVRAKLLFLFGFGLCFFKLTSFSRKNTNYISLS